MAVVDGVSFEKVARTFATAARGIAPALRGGTMSVLACALALSACSEKEDPIAANPAIGAGMFAPGAAGVPGGAAGMAPPVSTAGVGAAGMAPATAGTGALPMAGAGVAAGMGGTAGAAGTAAPPTSGAGGTTPEVPDAGTEPQPDAMVGPPPAEDLGEGDGSDVITIGDSWMNLGLEGIQQSLRKASGQPYRMYAQPGTRMLSGEIPGQYDSAKRADPDIKTVVMTGGGNDVLLTGLSSACASGSMTCLTRLEEIVAEFDMLWSEMATDGVRDVVLIHYASDAGDGLNPSLMHDQRLMMHCGSVPEPMRCHLLFTDDIVMSQFRDGVHPTAAAYDRLGVAVYDMMVAEGMRR